MQVCDKRENCATKFHGAHAVHALRMRKIDTFVCNSACNEDQLGCNQLHFHAKSRGLRRKTLEAETHLRMHTPLRSNLQMKLFVRFLTRFWLFAKQFC